MGRICRLSLLIATACLGPALRLRAEDPQPDSSKPVVVINVASVERLLNQALTTFESAGRPELAETLGGALDRVNNLKGFDRNQPVGVMIYLNGLMPEVVGYVPVKDFDEVLKTIEIGPITTKKTGEDRFEIVGQRQTLYGKVQSEYAFVARSTAALDREFRDPAAMTTRLSREFDLAASFSLKSIPPPTRDLFLNLLRAKSESDLQRRDNEPEAAYRLRRAGGQRNIELIDELVRQGEEVTIGWTVSAADRTATLEVGVIATGKSELATYFNELKGVRSRFAALLAAKVPLTASLSWKLDRPAKKMFQEMISAVEVQWMKDLGDSGDASSTDAEAARPNPILQLVQVLRGTTEAGHLDLILQFVSQPSGSFVLVGGVRVAEGTTLSPALTELFSRLKANDALAEARADALSHQGISFHRLEFKRARPQDERLYGAKPGLFVGVGNGVLWLALGGDDASAELKRTIDKAAEPVAEGVNHVPLQFVMNFASWMDVFDPERKPDGLAALARNAFAKGGDSLRIEALPIDDGLRLKITMDEAFLRLVGQQIAKQIDASEE